MWLPASSVLEEKNAGDTIERAEIYLQLLVVAGSAPAERSAGGLRNVSATVAMPHQRNTPIRLRWAKDYSDYHPEEPGGASAGRTCECRPLNASVLGAYRTRLRPGVMEVNIPMPTTTADYRWMNLVTRVPHRGIPTIIKRLVQGAGGMLVGRRYVAGGQALAAGLFAGVIRAGIPIWTETKLQRLTTDGHRINGAVVSHNGRDVTVNARRGVVLAAGGLTTACLCGGSFSPNHSAST